MSQTTTPEAAAAAEKFLRRGDSYNRKLLALAFDAHTKDLQNTIARLTRELGEARDAEAAEIAAWLRSFDGQDEKAIAAGDCARGSTTHGELRDQAAYYRGIADAIARREHRKD